MVTTWDPDRLRALLHTQLRGDQVIVVSNAKPICTRHGPNGIVVKRRPAAW